MVAKLIVHGATREEALARLDDALAQTHIVGLATNVQFLRHVVQQPLVCQGQPRHGADPARGSRAVQPGARGPGHGGAAAVAKRCWTSRRKAARRPLQPPRRLALARRGAAPFRVRVPWRAGQGRAALPARRRAALAVATSRPLRFNFARRRWHRAAVRGQRTRAVVYPLGETVHVFTAAGATQIVVDRPAGPCRRPPGEGGRLTAPMPGKVVSFSVKAGDKVSKGQALAVMEAMKMEHTIAAPADGAVQELLYAPGDQVAEGGAAEARGERSRS
jgi:3-methylcrotonyl-CoA carboxylase alpha subunit